MISPQFCFSVPVLDVDENPIEDHGKNDAYRDVTVSVQPEDFDIVMESDVTGVRSTITAIRQQDRWTFDIEHQLPPQVITRLQRGGGAQRARVTLTLYDTGTIAMRNRDDLNETLEVGPRDPA